MAEFNPLASFIQGQASRKQQQQFGQQRQIRDLQAALSGQAGQAGFDPSSSVELQQLAALDPSAAATTLSTFQALDKPRRQAFFQDARTGLDLLEKGDFRGFEEFASNRLENVNRLGGDPSDVADILQTFASGDVDGTINKLANVEQIGIDQGFLKDTTVKKQPLQKGEKGLVFDPNLGTFSLDPVAKARFDELAEKKSSTGKIDLKDKQSINKDITGFIKNSVAIRSTANDLDKLSKLGTGPAAIAAVFKFMKANDPESTVREGEFATAEQSAGVPAQITNFYNKLVTGERLTADQIQQFVETSKVLANSAISSSTTEVNRFLNTFGEDLPVKFQRSVRKRLPDIFDLSGIKGFEDKPPASIAAPTGEATPSGQTSVIGRFTVEVQ